jgi:hypothetical protein
MRPAQKRLRAIVAAVAALGAGEAQIGHAIDGSARHGHGGGRGPARTVTIHQIRRSIDGPHRRLLERLWEMLVR